MGASLTDPILLPQVDERAPAPSADPGASLTPKAIVRELDRYIIGQDRAKKAVAIALRNRWRRLQVSDALRDEIMPNNIIMIGPTGVGKTEVARRLAHLADAPFIKVEASKYTEVGYVGRDVESIVRDLVDISVTMVKVERTQAVQREAEELAEDRLLDLLLPASLRGNGSERGADDPEARERWIRTREKMRERLARGDLDSRQIELEVPNDRFPMVEVFSPAGMEEMGINIQEMFGGLIPPRVRRRRISVPEGRKILVQEEAQKLIDMDEVIGEAVRRVETSGIVFLDEIDKLVGDHGREGGGEVSREGVQRDILPIIEGSSVTTKYGMVNTDHVLFVAAGAFHSAKPSDLIPELQGRFPIRVELDSLGAGDFARILTEPENALLRQYTALMETEGIHLHFTPGAVREIAAIADGVNQRTENIGARRLHTVMTTLLEDLLFEAPTTRKGELRITQSYVRSRLRDVVADEDLARYIL